MRLGCLPYLNVKPLVYTLERGRLPEGWELVYAPPSQLAQMLAREEIAAAPVSSFATFVDPTLDICPGICIAAYGPVKSVLMLSKKPVQEVRSVALDTSSLSGAAMLRILLSELHGLEPEFVRLPPDPVSAMLENCDAALVIGNPAMQCSKEGLFVMDLAEQWLALTGLSAVFAVWAGRGITPELVEVLHEARALGMTRLEEIAREQSPQLGLSYELCLEYLSKIMIYEPGEDERRGLEAFRRKAQEHGLVAQAEVAAK